LGFQRLDKKLKAEGKNFQTLKVGEQPQLHYQNAFNIGLLS
jgi:hypothetical protein